MKITGYLDTNRPSGKITSYEITVNDEIFFLDFGFDDLDKNKIKRIKYIFISHEHYDHFKALFQYAEHLSTDVVIYMTKTVKKLIELNFDIMYNQAENKISYEKKTRILNQIIVVYMNETINVYEKENKYLKISVYPSGHTYGSAMIYIDSNEYQLLYTGDMDLSTKINDKAYYFDFSKKVDYLIFDGTNILSEQKQDMVSKIIMSNKNRNQINFLVKPEKAVDIAKILSKHKNLKDYKIIYKRDLYPYIKVLENEGYDVFIDQKVLLELQVDMPRYEKEIHLSTRKSQAFANKFNYTLHIARNDLNEFFAQFITPPKLLMGHYDRINIEDVKNTANSHGYILLKEGENHI